MIGGIRSSLGSTLGVIVGLTGTAYQEQNIVAGRQCPFHLHALLTLCRELGADDQLRVACGMPMAARAMRFLLLVRCLSARIFIINQDIIIRCLNS